jgi:hypothetical protein
MPTQGQEPELGASGGMSGIGTFRRGEWGKIRTLIKNPTDRAVQPVLSIRAREANDIQYAARVWLPPKSRREVHSPFKAPQTAGEDGRSFPIETQLIDPRGGRSIQLDRTNSSVIHQDQEMVTGEMRGDGSGTSLLQALRSTTRYGPTTSFLSKGRVPSTLLGIEGLDALCISRTPDMSADQIEALRQWVAAGGHLWLRLDKIEEGFGERLLGAAWSVTRLERMDLTEFTVHGPYQRSHTVKRDYPVRVERVMAPDMETLHTVRGYPASMRKQVGHGQLLITTVNGDAWLDEEDEANSLLRQLDWFLPEVESDEGPKVEESLAQYGQQSIGHRVLGRTPVAAVLGGLVIVMLGVGGYLYWRDRLEHLAWAGGALGLVATAALLGLGTSQRQSTPDTKNTTGLVQVSPKMENASVEAVASLYHSGSVDQITGSAAMPDVKASLSSQVGLRMTWRDSQSWRLENLELPPGVVKRIPMKDVQPLTDVPEAELRFTEDGVAGRVVGEQFGLLGDAVIATANGYLAAPLDQEGRFKRSPGVAPAQGTFFGDKMTLSNREQARQRVYRGLLARPDFPRRPVLMGWSNAPLNLTRVPQAAVQQDESVVTLPLKLREAEAGSEVMVPTQFLPFRPVQGDRMPNNTAYNIMNGTWQQVTTGQTVLMRYEVPEEVKPLELEKATLLMRMEAPRRPFYIVTFRDGRVVTLESGSEASGEMIFTLEGDDLPARTEDGDILLGVDVGESQGTGNNPWEIERLQLAVAGTVQSRGESD